MKYILFVLGIILALIFVLQDILEYLKYDSNQVKVRRRGFINLRPMVLIPLGYYEYFIKSNVFFCVYVLALLNIIFLPNTILLLKYYKRSKRKKDFLEALAFAFFYLLGMVFMIKFLYF